MARIPRSERLRRAQEIREVRARGACARGKSMSVYVTEAPAYRFGIIAGRRLRLAVQRNRARRILREAMQRLRPRLRVDRAAAILIAARPEILSATATEVLAELEGLLAAHGFLQKQP